ncbi:12947_t:CDS:2 [Funneliformis geosporum]|uniref:17705_t:CDS:1 n=1 Tax=Funneliformis geosporum TaxID=1117311 RepID=A0A9W4X177_9GLOM|nr:17705_t:CDS:2 [Funneliformis geosporum]CAI2187986.1 12947_t:CDS:2 [Funneliformis geosporum]
MERSDLLDKHFCKYPVIFLSLKGFDGCETWSAMQAQLCQQLATLYEEHKYVYEKLSYSPLNASRFDQIYSGVLKDGITNNALLYLSKYLKDYHRSKCIVLIDEYDHPIDVAYRYKYYEEARGFLASLFRALLKSNDENLEKALLVGMSRVAKSGYLSGLNNMQVFPMHDQEYADKFGFTEEEVEMIKDWYDGYMASNGRIHLYNPWSINKFISTNNLEAHWVDIGCTTTIKKLLWHSTEDFRKKTLTLLQKGAINVEILKDIDYLTLSPHASDVLWTLLYYEGYLTMNKEKKLCIPNTEVFTEWKGWLNNRISSNPDTMLEMLLQCHLTKFEEELPTMIMESLLYFDTTDNSTESNYHWLMVGILSPVRYHNYEFLSNREAGVGRFDVRISLNTKNVIYPVSIIMEFKKSEEALAQIIEKKYRTGIRTTKLVECGIAFQGKRAYVLSRVLRKERDQWVEDEKKAK